MKQMKGKSALVIVDMQKGYEEKIRVRELSREIAIFARHTVEPLNLSSASGNHQTETAAVQAQNTLPFQLVITTQYLNHPQTACYRFENWKSCMSGTAEAELSNEIEALSGIVPVYHTVKDQYTCWNEEFRNLVREQGITRMFFCGINTGCCVLHSVLDAYEACEDVYILEWLCGSTSGEHYHDIAIELLKTLITGSRVLSLADFRKLQSV